MDPECKNIAEVVEKHGYDKAMTLAKQLPDKEGNLVLRNRAIHVLEEGRRVHMMQGSSIEKWGELMNQSHESCSKLYECSCPELEDLVSISRKHGALGSRLTGAGWGGSTVSILPPDASVDEFIENVKKDYYVPRGIKNPVIFATKPGDGSSSIIF